jgi:hypothetical protein
MFRAAADRDWVAHPTPTVVPMPRLMDMVTAGELELDARVSESLLEDRA